MIPMRRNIISFLEQTPSITVNAPSSLRRFSDGARYVLQMSRDGGEGSPPTRQLMSPAVASVSITQCTFCSPYSSQMSLAHARQIRHFSSNNGTPLSPHKPKMMPRKAALNLTPKARDIFRKLISATASQGIILKYEISSQHALRMAFKFDLVKDLSGLGFDDEG